MKAKLLTLVLLAGVAIAAELPAPFHHVRIATLELGAKPTKVSRGWLPGIPYSSIEGAGAVGVGATRKIGKHWDYSWTTSRYGVNDRYTMQPGNAAQHWSSAAKIQFHF